MSKWADGAPAGGGDFSYRLSLDAGIPRLDLSSSGAAVYTLNGVSAVAADEWTHVAATRNGAVVKLIVNDAVVVTDTFAGALHDGPAPVRVGACAVDGAEGFFAGLVDEVRISDTDREGALGTVEVGYTYNARNQLVTETSGTSVKAYSYDMNGNTVMIAEAVNGIPVAVEAMTYDELNRMTSYAGPRGSESFAYRGAEWHRFSQSASGVGKSFLYDGDNVVADIAGGSTQAFYVTPFLDQNLSMTKDSATYYYSQDGLGSVRTLSDAAGSVKNRYDYNAFGQVFTPATDESVANPYTFTARRRDGGSGLMYYRYRQYDTEVGRFVARDPMLPGTPFPYLYVRNRPTTRSDPMGLYTINKDGCCRIPKYIATNKDIIEKLQRMWRNYVPGETWTDYGLPGTSMANPTGYRSDYYQNAPECFQEATDEVESLGLGLGMALQQAVIGAHGYWNPVSWIINEEGYAQIQWWLSRLLIQHQRHNYLQLKLEVILQQCMDKFGQGDREKYEKWRTDCCKEEEGK